MFFLPAARPLLLAALTLATVALPTLAQAQFAETIRPGRPGAAIEPYTIGARVLQSETGVSVGRVRTFGEGETKPVGANTYLRLGLTERFEVNAIVTYLRRRRRGASGVNDTEVGGRYTVALESAVVPAVAIQTSVLLRWRGADYRSPGAGVTTIVSAGKGFGERFGLTANYGFTHDGEAAGVTSFYVLAPGFSLTDRLALGGDIYGDLGSDFDVNLDLGVAYAVGTDWQLDAQVAWEALGDFAADRERGAYADWDVEVGVSWRVDWREDN